MKYLTNNGTFKSTLGLEDKALTNNGVFKVVDALNRYEKIITDSGMGFDYVEQPLLSGTYLTTGNFTATLKFKASSGKSIAVSWGDGESDTSINFTNTSTETITHDYVGAGSRNVSVTGDLDSLTYIGFGNNKFSTLKVNYLEALTKLECYGNVLTSLETKYLTNLVTLTIYSNNLTSLDLSTLPKLSVLDYGTNSVPNLDISNLTTLTTIWCERNSITSLDLSALINLTNLYCTENLLTNLDISNNNKIKELFSESNKLTVNSVSKILTDLDSFGLSSGYVWINLQTPSAVPNASGQTAKTNLQTKLWNISVDN